MEKSIKIYSNLCKDIHFKTYQSGLHSPDEALEDIKELLENELKKDD